MRNHINILTFFLFYPLFTINTCFAANPGAYMGLQAGVANVHQGEFLAYHLDKLVSKYLPEHSTDALNIVFNNTGFAGRVFAGYQFNSYVAVEMGYYHFTPLEMNIDLKVDPLLLNSSEFYLPLEFSGKATIHTYVLDLVGKFIYPMTDKFSLYGKLGIAYLNAAGNIMIAMKTSIVDLSISSNPQINVIYPTFGLGLNYDMTEHFSTDLSWLHVQKYNSDCFPSTDLVSAGLIYHF